MSDQKFVRFVGAEDVQRWQGERSRPLALYRPCKCGCSPNWYLSASDRDGYGFTIVLTDDAAARVLNALDPEEPTCQPSHLPSHQSRKRAKK